jgi:putative inorganic carbon (HCO3(-)) transporter
MKGLIVTYLLSYGGATAALFNPFVGLCAYVALAILRPWDLWHWSVPLANFSKIAAGGMLIGWAIRGFGSWQFGRAKAVTGFLLAFWAWVILSSLQAAQTEVSLDWAGELTKIVLPFVVGITLIDSVAKLKQLAWVIVLCHGYVAYELNLSYYAGFNRIQEIGFGGMDNNSFSIGTVACTGLALFLGFNTPRWWQKGLAFAAAALMAHSVMFSFSRGGMLGLIITIGVGFLLLPKKPRHYLVFVLIVLVGLRLAGPEVTDRFWTTFADKETRDTSAESRLQLWQTCWAIMSKAPIFGIGPRQFPLIAHEYGYTRLKEAHSLWLSMGAETGVVGLFFLASFYGVCMLRLWPLTRASHSNADPWIQDSARMVVASLTGFAVSSQFVSVAGLEAPYFVALLGAGVLKLTSLPARDETSSVTGQNDPESPDQRQDVGPQIFFIVVR